ncbi:MULTISPECIES: LacI family DNA-binding transcriptional regulator [Streptomyces]|uniref:LacI family DNA-binding transcriptional regulator n=1 Tax=Streptomyces TaxID=1883 RepID=UPI00103FD499|nr:MULTISPECIES: LacI family DNA-binding transcriptional regulator [Streptomyces]MDI7790810.1 LacI family DNA-binding transcriptional regulator [Streptomyces cavourensis]
MAVTIREVAALAGVHVSTVSRALSAPHLVNAATRERVMASARQLGYRPNRAASALTTGRTHNLGLIVSDIANPFFPPLIKAAQAYSREREYHVFVADTDEDPQIEEELIRTLTKQVDGVVLVAPRLTNQTIERLSLELPFVVVNRKVKGVSTVLMDIGHGTETAVAHLCDLGHRHLALLAGPRTSWTSEQMRRAAGRAAEARQVQLTVIGPNAPSEHGGTAAASRVLASGATAVIAYNDLMAIGVIEGLAEAGAGVPGDVSVVGVDDTVAGRLSRPKLTTIMMPTAAAGRAAVDLLLQRIDDAADVQAQTILETGLTVRESTRPPAKP